MSKFLWKGIDEDAPFSLRDVDMLEHWFFEEVEPMV